MIERDPYFIVLRMIEKHQGGEAVKSLRESMRDEYVVKVLHEILREIAKIQEETADEG